MYLLDTNKLNVGDIILESGNTKIISDLIKEITDSDFSHSMIYVDLSMIHATGAGVFSINPQRLLIKDSNHLKVLRLKDKVNSIILKSICDNARAKVGSLYSKKEAVRSVINDNDKYAKNRKQFCSRLVAQCYEQSGIFLVNNSDYCTPEDLNRSDLLFEVKNCVREAKEADIEFSQKDDPIFLNQKETFKWLKEARKLFKKKGVDIQTVNDVSSSLIRDGDLDKKICRIIKSTQYLSQYNIDRTINPYRYETALLTDKLLNATNQNKIIDSEKKLIFLEINRHRENLTASKKNYNAIKQNFMKLHVKLYRNILKENKKKLQIMSKSLSMLNLPTHEIDMKLNELGTLLK